MDHSETGIHSGSILRIIDHPFGIATNHNWLADVLTPPNRDVTADGQRFLINTNVAEGNPAPITIVLNWMAGLKK